MVTAGPTREYFDPVRFLSNPSSGKMGYAIAEAALKRGARVTLISGHVSLKPPKGARHLFVKTAGEMYQRVMKEAPRAEIILMAAAVSDWMPIEYSRKKLKKLGRTLTIRLRRTRDILKELGQRKRGGQILVGFAAETDHLVQNALKKLRGKNLDFIVANKVGGRTGGFESDRNRAVLIGRGARHPFPLLSKKQLASRILRRITTG